MENPTITFTETTEVGKKKSEFDITSRQIEEYMAKEEVDFMRAYNDILLITIANTNENNIKKFLLYHADMVQDGRGWLVSLDDLYRSRFFLTSDLQTVREIIKELINEIDSHTPNEHLKILSNLTVDTLGYLFRSLVVLKFIKPRNVAQVFRMLENNFFTKKSRETSAKGLTDNSKEMSLKTLRDKSKNPSDQAIDKLELIGIQLTQKARNDREAKRVKLEKEIKKTKK